MSAEDKKTCLSTHGGAGYTIGDYWDGDEIVCVLCGQHIKNPRPTSYRIIEPGILGYIFRGERKKLIPDYPVFLRGTQGVPFKTDLARRKHHDISILCMS